jgi:uncharacterized protein
LPKATHATNDGMQRLGRSPAMITRKLHPEDKAQLESFLLKHRSSSLILLSNLTAVGIVDNGETYHATYVGAFEGDQLVGVVAHAWNENLILQAPEHAGLLAQQVAVHSRRRIGGFIGPWSQVVAAREALEISTQGLRFQTRDELFHLELEQMVAPALLTNRVVTGRRAATDDVEVLSKWRASYNHELLKEPLDAGSEARTRADIERLISAGRCFVLERDGQLVAMTGFNSAYRDCVQVGGVWTPHEHRGLGYARNAVAASLLIAKAEGATESVLFTGDWNVAAQKAYVALGYKKIGDYGLAFLPKPTGA